MTGKTIAVKQVKIFKRYKITRDLRETRLAETS